MEKSVKCCYLVCAGEMKTPLNIEKKPFDKIIAVDGGLKKLRQAGIVPDLIAGDFDSLGFKPETGKLLCLPVEKDVTDSYAPPPPAGGGGGGGAHILMAFGGTGGRTEHTFANVQLLAALAKRGVKGFLADDGRTLFVSDGGTTKIAARKSGYVSVFSLDTKCEGVTLKGLKYPLSGYTLTNEFPIGVSNEFIGQTAEIIVEKGVYLVVAECSPDDFS